MSNEVSITYEGSLRVVATLSNEKAELAMGGNTCCGGTGTDLTPTDFTPLDALAAAYAACVMMSMDLGVQIR